VYLLMVLIVDYSTLLDVVYSGTLQISYWTWTFTGE